MAEVSIKGTTRTEFGKGASRRARVSGLVPAVIYGHGEKPVHITLPARELGVALKESNVLLNIDIDGKIELTLPKSIVRHPLKQILEHIDLVLVRRGEKVTVSVPVHTEGKHDPDGNAMPCHLMHLCSVTLMYPIYSPFGIVLNKTCLPHPLQDCET